MLDRLKRSIPVDGGGVCLEGVKSETQMKTATLQDTGHVSSDEPRGLSNEQGEAGPRKRTRSENDAVASSTEPSNTRRSKRTRFSKDKSVASSVAAKPSDPSMQLRPRKPPKYETSGMKPRTRPGISMKLRNRTMPLRNMARYGSTQSQPTQADPVGTIYKENRRSIDTGECEVCLHPYALSYLSKHRKKVHELSHQTLGCPYCSETFSSPALRVKHIQRMHPSRPSAWSVDGCNDLSKVKVHMYACPLCPAHFTHSGLACHLGSSHHTSIDEFRGHIFCKCPFCIASSGDGKQLGRFQSEEELREHISRKHKGCFLLDDIKPPAGRTFDRPYKKVSHLKKAAAAPKKAAIPSEEPSEDETWSEMEDSLSGQEEHWERLNYRSLVSDYMYGDYVPMDFGMTLSSAINAVDAQLNTLGSNKDTTDEEYVSEMKLYNKGLKDRQQKADAERIEKERHREEVERKLLRLQYENRNKKRLPEDIEYDEFLVRPFLFVLSTRESARKANCPLGENCELCVSRAQEPETDASGQLIDAPSYHGNVVGDSLKDAASPEKASAGGSDRRGNMAAGRRRGRRVDSTIRSLFMLQELKHSLHFVAGYNGGYFRR